MADRDLIPAELIAAHTRAERALNAAIKADPGDFFQWANAVAAAHQAMAEVLHQAYKQIPADEEHALLWNVFYDARAYHRRQAREHERMARS